MTLREIRKRALTKMEGEILRLEKDLVKMRSSHEVLKQSLFDTSKRLKDTPDSSLLLDETENIKKKIADVVVDIRNLDARLSRMKNRAKRWKRTN